MIARAATILITFMAALAILIVSVFRSASVRYVFSQSPSPSPSPVLTEIDYEFVYPGRILPDHPLWSFKVIRDKIWLIVTTSPLKKADLYLLMADKRLASAKALFEKNKAEVGVSTLTKSEKYLELAFSEQIKAKDKGADTADFLLRFSGATLKHREVLEEIINMAPEDARPVIVQAIDYPKRLFNDSKTAMMELGIDAPDNPFEQ